MIPYLGQRFAFDDSLTGSDTYYRLVLISKYDSHGNPIKNYEPFRFFVYSDKTHLKLSLETNKFSYLTKYEAIRQIDSIYELVAIVPQLTSDKKYGFIFLFSDNLKIRWCWSLGNELDKEKVRPFTSIERLTICI